MRALTLTLHPAIDRVIDVERLTPGDTFNGRLKLMVPAGKGVNTARSLRKVAGKSLPIAAAVWVGQEESEWFSHSLMAKSNVRALLCTRPCATRMAQTILEPGGRETHIKEQMAAPAAREQGELIAFWKRIVRASDVVAICGSAPKGTSLSTLRQIFSIAAEAKFAIADTNGVALEAASRAGLYGIKGNAAEFGELLGLSRPIDIQRDEDREALRERLRSRGGPQSILMTMGADGAAFISIDNIFVAPAPPLGTGQFLSATGCGDAATAGWMWALTEPSRRRSPLDVLARAIALGTAKAANADPGDVKATLVRSVMQRISIRAL